ncbi:tRNA (adenosine(37)-N6)-threonylcarbamoyltransferase complex dimerization subunit type 1 TsaB [Roseovarius aestuariivivens]|uniref:tRNA (adenosine(37)-N6)-threonylcarbamoyltransferase complex dimerization subunit type 1 TsaB n=1 Tax=Roseovarius aestuariivivens TaxID=1888910 RepID=UPI0010818A8E|nr:tRNA (adenosine(37)-N6)-threonylcarbamoyltransferase complex dimerization subunit type 1 TsaB [Roseovarius aestuariivivens]
MASSDQTILAFDTSAAHCAAALLCGGGVVTKVEEMGRGQAERLMPLIQELLDSKGIKLKDLTRIGVGIGPGNFTGIRISVSLARGLALGLGTQAVGVSTFAALRHATGLDAAAVPAPRDTAYLLGRDGAPVIVPAAEVPASTAWPDTPAALVAAIAELAALAPPDSPSPAPLYVRPADAAPSRETPPRILDDA